MRKPLTAPDYGAGRIQLASKPLNCQIFAITPNLSKVFGFTGSDTVIQPCRQRRKQSNQESGFGSGVSSLPSTQLSSLAYHEALCHLA